MQDKIIKKRSVLIEEAIALDMDILDYIYQLVREHTGFEIENDIG